MEPQPQVQTANPDTATQQITSPEAVESPISQVVSQEPPIIPPVENKPVQAPPRKPNHQGEGGGAPEVITEAVVLLLVGAFQNGLGVREACVYAGISKSAFYDRRKRDAKFLDTMERAQNNLVELAGDRIVSILREGSDRDAGPLAWKIFEKKIPEMYGSAKIDSPEKPGDNFYVFNFNQLAGYNQQPAIKEGDPTELLEALEVQPVLDTGAEEESTPPVHSEEVRGEYPNESDMPQPSSTV